ncbi:MAG: TIGR02594 family protein [Caulobacter sp.]|nr:TIGR02594 family protein [Caulobacter sp.]
MTAIPAKYAYLRADPRAPLMVQAALDLYGVREAPGGPNNPQIIAWADEVGSATKSAYADWAASWYASDATAWCGLFMAVCAVRSAQGRAERLPEHKYLSALEWKNWGVPVAVRDAVVGDVGISQREGGGHVFLIVGEDATHFHILGGNQGDTVSIVRKAKGEVIAVRRPHYRERPGGARKVMLTADGAPLAGREG